MTKTQKAFDENVKRLNKSKKSTSTKITITQSRKKDLFPMMGVHKFPYRFEPMPEIADRLNLASVSYTHLTLPTTPYV